jgi:MFS family permease
LADRRRLHARRFFRVGREQYYNGGGAQTYQGRSGWSRTLPAAAINAGALLGGVLAPFFSPIADRLGSRLSLPCGAALMGGLAMVLSASTQPRQFYAAFVPAYATIFAAFLVCYCVAAALIFFPRQPAVR